MSYTEILSLMLVMPIAWAGFMSLNKHPLIMQRMLGFSAILWGGTALLVWWRHDLITFSPWIFWPIDIVFVALGINLVAMQKKWLEQPRPWWRYFLVAHLLGMTLVLIAVWFDVLSWDRLNHTVFVAGLVLFTLLLRLRMPGLGKSPNHEN